MLSGGPWYFLHCPTNKNYPVYYQYISEALMSQQIICRSANGASLGGSPVLSESLKLTLAL